LTQFPPKRRPIREESPDRIGGVLGLITHDLRNPLAALSSNAGFLHMVGDSFSEEVREALHDVQLSIEALTRIVDSLELVSHDLGTISGPAPIVVRVGDLLRTVLPPVERAAQSHGVQLVMFRNGHDDDRIRVGEVYFIRSLVALLLNAITAAPARSEVVCSLLVDGDDFVFRVTDDGAALDPGLTEAALSAVGQLEIKTARAGRYSRGLGLYVVARSSELAGAHIRVGSSQTGSVIELVCTQAV
jgi:signal transduction histidine kinase